MQSVEPTTSRTTGEMYARPQELTAAIGDFAILRRKIDGSASVRSIQAKIQRMARRRTAAWFLDWSVEACASGLLGYRHEGWARSGCRRFNHADQRKRHNLDNASAAKRRSSALVGRSSCKTDGSQPRCNAGHSKGTLQQGVRCRCGSAYPGASARGFRKDHRDAAISRSPGSPGGSNGLANA